MGGALLSYAPSGQRDGCPRLPFNLQKQENARAHAGRVCMKQEIVLPMFAGIGNALLAVPLLRVLKKRCPVCRLTVLAGSEAIAEVFARLDAVDELIVCAGGTPALFKAGMALRLRRPGFFLIPAPSRRWQYLLMAACVNAGRTVMHAYTDRPRVLRHALRLEIVAARPGLHDVHQNLLLLDALEPAAEHKDDPDEAPVFTLYKADRAAAAEMLLRAGFCEHQQAPVIVHAGSGATALADAKRWPPEHCSWLLRALRQESDRPIIVIEGPDEPGLADEVLACAAVENTSSVRLNCNLGISAALLHRAVLYIGSDSGLAHLAAAVGTPPVTLFGPADPDRMSPFGYRHLVVQARTDTCRACHGYPWRSRYPKITCDHGYACMRDITSEDVLEKALPVLRQAEGQAQEPGPAFYKPLHMEP